MNSLKLGWHAWSDADFDGDKKKYFPGRKPHNQSLTVSFSSIAVIFLRKLWSPILDIKYRKITGHR
jgi:hypothetical protein